MTIVEKKFRGHCTLNTKDCFYSSVSNTWDKESLPVDKKEPIQDFSFSDNETSEGIVTS